MKEIDHAYGPGWSPDGGYFWRKGGKIYWEDGDITGGDAIMREMPSMGDGYFSKVENFSEWSDEKRETVKAGFKKERDDRRAESDAYISKIMRLCESARNKLTPEEYDAVESYGYHEGTYWP